MSKEIIDYDRKFFTKQLDRVAKSYQNEIRAHQTRAREKAIEYVEKNMFVAREELQSEVQRLLQQFSKSSADVEGMKKLIKT